VSVGDILERLLPPEVRRRRLIGALVVASVLLGVLVFGATATSFGPDGQQASRTERAELMKRASELISQVMSYNAATAEDDIAAAKSAMTESMQDDYDRTLPSAADRKRQANSGIKVVARVARIDGVEKHPCPLKACAVGVASMTEDEATVLVFVNQFATATSTKNAVLSPTWEIIRMVKRDGDWVIARMEAP
jgi:hypothetical protein